MQNKNSIGFYYNIEIRTKKGYEKKHTQNWC
jgi:hypothetical protein